MATSVPVDAPWAAPNAAEWDGQTLETWAKNNSVSQRFRDLLPAATRPIFGTEPRELSLLFTLFYIASSGNETTPGTFERNFDTRNGGQQDRFVGGSSTIPPRVAAALGSRVMLGPPGRRVVQDRRGGSVVTDTQTARR